MGLGVSGILHWQLVGWKICVMSAHYALLRSLLSLPFVAAAMLGAGPPTSAPVGVLIVGFLSVFALAPLSWLLSFLWTAIVCCVLLPCVYLAQRLFGESPKQDTTGWISGSTVAVVGSLGGISQFGVLGLGTLLPFGVGSIGSWLLMIAAETAGIAAAQAGGYLGSLNGLRRRRKRSTEASPIRFTTWRMMALTAIVALILSLLKLAGDTATIWIGAWLLIGALIAWAIHRPVAWLTNRWLDWRLKKRRAKRARVTPPASLPARTS